MNKKLVISILTIIMCISTIPSAIFGSTGYVPSDDEIAPVSTITTGDKALSDINIRIFQPFLNEMDDTSSDVIALPEGIISDAQCPVAPVKIMQENYGALIKTIRTYNKPISLEDIQSLGPNQIIIFSGHGSYLGPEIHSTILTGRDYDEKAYDNDPLYKQDVDEGRITKDGFNEVITSKYIDKYCPNLTNSFVFLGICQGAYHCGGEEGADDTLVKAFLNKGAKAVFGYSQTTDMRYSNVMVYSIMKDLGNKKTLGEAFTNAKNKYGDTDPSIARSVPLIFPSDTAGDFSIDSMFNSKAPVSRNYVFDGKEKVGVLDGVGYSLSGDLIKKDVGNYEVIATLKPGFKWPDGTTESKTINWSITIADVSEADLAPNNVTLKYDENEKELMAIRNKDLGTYYFRFKGDDSYSTSIPKGTNVKDYKIEWYFVGDDNATNKGSSASPISYVSHIVKGERKTNEALIDDYYYGRSLPTPHLKTNIEDGTKIEYYYYKMGDYHNIYKWENMTSTTLDIGKYYLYAIIEETDNYKEYETFGNEFKVLEYIPKKDYTVPNTGIKIK